MGSSSFSLVLLLLALVKTGDSAAGKCHNCFPTNGCRETDCSTRRGKHVCSTIIYIEEGNEKYKECYFKSSMDKILGGSDLCRTATREDFKKKEFKVEFAALRSSAYKEDEYIRLKLENYLNDTRLDPMKQLTICSCTTDLCNTDANDDILVEANKGKMLEESISNDNGQNSNGNSKSSSTATTLLADSGNLGAVMSLALALAMLAALVPGSGFPRSQ